MVNDAALADPLILYSTLRGGPESQAVNNPTKAAAKSLFFMRSSPHFGAAYIHPYFRINRSCSSSVGDSGLLSPPFAFDHPCTAAANSQRVISSIWRGVKPKTAPDP